MDRLQFPAQGDGGVIINLVSTAGLQGHPNQSVYNISKGAQANLSRCLPTWRCSSPPTSPPTSTAT